MSAYASICQHTSTYVSIRQRTRQHTSAYVSSRTVSTQRLRCQYVYFCTITASTLVLVKANTHAHLWAAARCLAACGLLLLLLLSPPPPLSAAYVSIRTYTRSIRQHAVAAVAAAAAVGSIRQHTYVYVSIRAHTSHLRGCAAAASSSVSAQV